MFYRYEGRSKDEPNAEWQGVFMLFDPSQRRKWYCLTSPKWYENNEDVEAIMLVGSYAVCSAK